MIVSRISSSYPCNIFCKKKKHYCSMYYLVLLVFRLSQVVLRAINCPKSAYSVLCIINSRIIHYWKFQRTYNAKVANEVDFI